MRVYLVRHGATSATSESNYTYQSPTHPLSTKGKLQAQAAAKKLARLPIDRIITSPFIRTKETAEIVSKTLGVKLEKDDLLREVKRPSLFIGRSIIEPQIAKIRSEMDKKITDPSWRHSDEELFNEYSKRAKKFLNKLKKRSESNLVVVSHEAFIKVLVISVLLENKMTAELFLQIYKSLSIQNTGITTLEFNKKYKLISFNDHGHLIDA